MVFSVVDHVFDVDIIKIVLAREFFIVVKQVEMVVDVAASDKFKYLPSC